MTKMITITLKQGKEQSLERFHPWVFSGAVEKIVTDGNLKEGDVVEVYSSQREFMGIGQLSGWLHCRKDTQFYQM